MKNLLMKHIQNFVIYIYIYIYIYLKVLNDMIIIKFYIWKSISH
jgi:hypothetical protein